MAANTEPSNLLREFELASQDNHHAVTSAYTVDPSLLRPTLPVPSVEQHSTAQHHPATKKLAHIAPAPAHLSNSPHSTPPVATAPAAADMHMLHGHPPPHPAYHSIQTNPGQPYYSNSSFHPPIGSPANSTLHHVAPASISGLMHLGSTADGEMHTSSSASEFADSAGEGGEDFQSHRLSISDFLCKDPYEGVGTASPSANSNLSTDDRAGSEHLQPLAPAAVPQTHPMIQYGGYVAYPQASNGVTGAPFTPPVAHTVAMPYQHQHTAPLMPYDAASGTSSPQINMYGYLATHISPHQLSVLSGQSAADSTTPSTKRHRVTKKKRTGAKDPSEKKFACNIPGCTSTFKRAEHLKRHYTCVHTASKPYSCPHPGCNKTFSRQDNLHQHIKIHARK